MFSAPSISSLVPEATSHTRLHPLMIFSIIGELSLITTMTTMRATATMVAVTPATTVMIVLGTSMNNRMERRVPIGLLP